MAKPTLVGDVSARVAAALLLLVGLCLGLWAGAGPSLAADRGSLVEENRMHTLNIALNDGFRNQHVSITVNGRTVYDRGGVTTDLRISRADAVEVDVDGTRATVAVSVQGGQAQKKEIDVTATPFVAIDLQPDGSLRWTPSREARPML